MKLRSLFMCLAPLVFAVPAGQAALLWVVGIDDAAWNYTAAAPGNGGGANATFVQEAGTNLLPGNKANPELDQQGDDDYYFAGTYNTVIATNGAYTPVGLVSVNEESVERAFAGSDNTRRYHFNVPATYSASDRITVSFDALNLQGADATVTDPRYGVEVYINGNLVRPEQVIRPAQFDVDYTSSPKKLSEVGIVTGPGADNIVTLKGISYSGAGGGNWMGIDYVKVDIDNTPLIIDTFTTDDDLLSPGEKATLSWVLIEPGATVSIDQGIGSVTAQTTGGKGSITVTPGALTTYTLTATFGGKTQTRSVTVNTTSAAAILWEVGIDDATWNFTAAAPGNGGGRNTTFVQENGTINAPPGNKANAETDGQSDNDYYFSGTYSSVIPGNGTYTAAGTVTANEESVERAFGGADNAMRYHFNVPSSYKPEDRVTVSFDALNLDTSALDPRYGVEIYINSTLVRPEEIIRPAQFDTDYTSPPKRLSEVGIVTGPGADNIVTLKGINYGGAGGGNWMGIDYVKVNIDNTPLVINTFTAGDPLLRPGETTTLNWNLAQPGATVSIDQGIGDVTALTVNGSGSIAVNPAANTTYTITTVFGGQTQTKQVTVNTTLWSAIFEAGTDDASSAEFSHESAADDNYYFAGSYTAQGGPDLAVPESLNDDADTNTQAGRTGDPAIGFERSLTELDPLTSIWFIAGTAVKPEARVRVTADVLSASGVNTLEFSVNGTVLKLQESISGPQTVQFEITGLSSALTSGANRLTIRRTGSTIGGSVTFDHVMMEQLPGSLPAVTGITDDSILGTHTVNWTATAGATYRVQKSTDSGATWTELVRGFPAGGAPGTTLFYEDRITPWTDPRPQYRVLLE